MSSQGELYKKILTIFDNDIDTDYCKDILDEAAKEFPKYYLRYENDRSLGKYPTYEEFQEWFKKWFGEAK